MTVKRYWGACNCYDDCGPLVKGTSDYVLASDFHKVEAEYAAYRADGEPELVAANARIATLEAALKRYGDHDDDCNAANGRSWHPCTCGFAEILALLPPVCGEEGK